MWKWLCENETKKFQIPNPKRRSAEYTSLELTFEKFICILICVYSIIIIVVDVSQHRLKRNNPTEELHTRDEMLMPFSTWISKGFSTSLSRSPSVTNPGGGKKPKIQQQDAHERRKGVESILILIFFTLHILICVSRACDAWNCFSKKSIHSFALSRPSHRRWVNVRSKRRREENIVIAINTTINILTYPLPRNNLPSAFGASHSSTCATFRSKKLSPGIESTRSKRNNKIDERQRRTYYIHSNSFTSRETWLPAEWFCFKFLQNDTRIIL